jgi:hypothetical protein
VDKEEDKKEDKEVDKKGIMKRKRRGIGRSSRRRK